MLKPGLFKQIKEVASNLAPIDEGLNLKDLVLVEVRRHLRTTRLLEAAQVGEIEVSVLKLLLLVINMIDAFCVQFILLRLSDSLRWDLRRFNLVD